VRTQTLSVAQPLVLLLLQAADGTTTLAQQLPKALQQATLQRLSEDDMPLELMEVLVECSADVQQAQEQHLEQQQSVVTAQQQQLEQQQGEIAQLRQELRVVQASLAAVLQLLGQAEPGTA
jgi:hypothetical protein